MQISRTSSLHHKICVVERPTLGKSYSITGITYQGKGARATQPLDKNIVQEIVVIRIGCRQPFGKPASILSLLLRVVITIIIMCPCA